MTARVVGTVELRPLDVVCPNDWNPNRMTPAMKESLRYGLETDGWLASQALLIWGSDENDEAKNIIIDGEHRWGVATKLGMEEGPMVFLHGLEEARAKALTVKMNQKRGEFDEEQLGKLVRDIELDLTELGLDDLGLDMGFDDDELMRILAEPPLSSDAEAALVGGATKSSSVSPSGRVISRESIRLFQLLLDDETHAELSQKLQELGDKLGTKDASETVLEVVRRAHGDV